MSESVFDLHCDTALVLMGEGENGENGRSLRKNQTHIDLERASVLDGYVQCFACFTTPLMEEWFGKNPTTVFEGELAAVQREVEANGDRIAFAGSSAQIKQNREKGLMSAILTLEGTAGIAYDPGRLESLYQMGFHIVSLGWNEQNILTGSNVTGGGLTDRGRAFVEEAQRVGMLVDVSHISDEGFWNIMEITQGPVLATHSNSRAVCGHGRNLTDDMFRAICQTGGAAGFNQCGAFIGENPDLNMACDHFLHFLELDPQGTHLALGGDLDGCDDLPDGFAGVQDYPALARKLRSRGVDPDTVHRIFWGNMMEVFERCST